MCAMEKSKNRKQQCYISVPSQIINSLSSSSLQSLLLSPKKTTKSSSLKHLKNPRFWFLFLFLFGFLGMLRMYNFEPLVPFSTNPCEISHGFLNLDKNSETHLRLSGKSEKIDGDLGRGEEKISQQESLTKNRFLNSDSNSKTHLRVVDKSEKTGGNLGRVEEKSVFWEQPDGLGYRPCLDFGKQYRKWSGEIMKDRRKYLMVVVAGGMNQQRNQIVDAVVIARILGAALVVPILQVNVIWGDESEFSDIFDLDHFKSVLAKDVRIVSSLPSTHLMSRPVEEKRTPLHVSPEWIRARYLRRLRRDGVLLLRGLDSRLSKDLPSDLQKLRCKVAFHALKFAPQILQLGNMLTERMRSKGPYLALHLRLEKDVWVRTGCLPGLSQEYDEIINNERKLRPELLTSRSNMTYHDRKLAGLCPLNAVDVMRLLKALGAPKDARIFWAGGNPFGGKEALLPLSREFPHLYNKEDLALPGELEPFAKKASVLAAIDYIVSENSDVFMPSHGGNMGHAIQGHRAYSGHRKTITPNKRQMVTHFLNPSLPEQEFNRIILDLHKDSLGQPELRTSKAGRDVTKYPIPECMCNSTNMHT
ncbi:hypothetical protein LguiA_019428 [Lonicera macranthoides]